MGWTPDELAAKLAENKDISVVDGMAHATQPTQSLASPSPKKRRSGAYSETDFQRDVIKELQGGGWLVAHFRPALTKKGWRTAVSADGSGFPDIIAVKDERLLVLELKGEKGKASPEQVAWLMALDKVKTVTVKLIKPGQFNERWLAA